MINHSFEKIFTKISLTLKLGNPSDMTVSGTSAVIRGLSPARTPVLRHIPSPLSSPPPLRLQVISPALNPKACWDIKCAVLIMLMRLASGPILSYVLYLVIGIRWFTGYGRGGGGGAVKGLCGGGGAREGDLP